MSFEESTQNTPLRATPLRATPLRATPLRASDIDIVNSDITYNIKSSDDDLCMNVEIFTPKYKFMNSIKVKNNSYKYDIFLYKNILNILFGYEDGMVQLYQYKLEKTSISSYNFIHWDDINEKDEHHRWKNYYKPSKSMNKIVAIKFINSDYILILYNNGYIYISNLFTQKSEFIIELENGEHISIEKISSNEIKIINQLTHLQYQLYLYIEENNKIKYNINQILPLGFGFINV
jgi:hypothetical protein